MNGTRQAVVRTRLLLSALISAAGSGVCLGQLDGPCVHAKTPDALVAELEAEYQDRAIPPGCDGELSVALFEYGRAKVWYRPGDGDNEALRLAHLADPDRRGRAVITYSFLQYVAIGDFALDNEFTSIFGATHGIEIGRELVRQAMARWIRWGGIDMSEVADNATVPHINDGQFSQSAARFPAPYTVGDIRIGDFSGNYSLQCGGTVGYGQAPCAGGEVTLLDNTAADYWINTENTYRELRCLVMHEFGHALGFAHFNPQLGCQIMESTVPRYYEGLSHHEKRGLARNYGDRLAPNYAWNAAHDYGLLTDASVLEHDLATTLVPESGGPCPNRDCETAGVPCCLTTANPGDDWFSFKLDQSREVTISVDPTGGDYWYTKGPYGNVPPQPTTHIRANSAGLLRAYLWRGDPTQSAPLASTASGALGETKVVNAGALAANTAAETDKYYLLIRQTSAEPNQLVTQLYNLEIRIGDAKAPPRAVAGINKRVPSGTPTFFIGDLLSHATEPGAAIVRYRWDLNENGEFDDPEDAEGPRICASFDTDRAVTLEVTDSYGNFSTDTIQVSVH